MCFSSMFSFSSGVFSFCQVCLFLVVKWCLFLLSSCVFLVVKCFSCCQVVFFLVVKCVLSFCQMCVSVLAVKLWLCFLALNYVLYWCQVCFSCCLVVFFLLFNQIWQARKYLKVRALYYEIALPCYGDPKTITRIMYYMFLISVCYSTLHAIHFSNFAV